ncbi:hypothetical protein MRX96_040551 [Rhipicephalus microplus]
MCQSKIRFVASGPVRLTPGSPDKGIKVMASTICTNNKRGLMNVRSSCLYRAQWPSQLRRLFLYQMLTMTSNRVLPVVFRMVQYRCACPGHAALSLCVSMRQSKIRSVTSGPVRWTRVSPDKGIKVMASTVCTKNKKGFDECASIVPPPCPLAQSATVTVRIPDAHDDVDESGASSLPNGAVQMRMSRSAALSLCVSMCQSKIRSVATGPVRLTRVSPDKGIKVMASTVCKKKKKRFDECASIVPPPCPVAQSATATVLIPDAHDDVDESGASSLPNDAVQMRMSGSCCVIPLCIDVPVEDTFRRIRPSAVDTCVT